MWQIRYIICFYDKTFKWIHILSYFIAIRVKQIYHLPLLINNNLVKIRDKV